MNAFGLSSPGGGSEVASAGSVGGGSAAFTAHLPVNISYQHPQMTAGGLSLSQFIQPSPAMGLPAPPLQPQQHQQQQGPSHGQQQGTTKASKKKGGSGSSAKGGSSGRSHPNPIAWSLVGVFESLEQMNEVLRRSKHVSKRKQDQQRMGLKISYRCNGWKRYRCPYKMYAMCQNGTSQITLYEHAKHDHSITYPLPPKNHSANSQKHATTVASRKKFKKKDVNNSGLSYTTLISPTMVNPSNTVVSHRMDASETGDLSSLMAQFLGPSSSSHLDLPAGAVQGGQLSSVQHAVVVQQPQPRAHQNIVVKNEGSGGGQQQMGGFEELGGRMSNAESVASPPAAGANNDDNRSQPPATHYTLSDPQTVTQFMQIAADNQLLFSYNPQRSVEYCFSSPALGGASGQQQGGGGGRNSAPVPPKEVILEDLGHQIRVGERNGSSGEDISEEFWLKADWSQFLWAVRAKVGVAFKK